jgi:hypothetical protein
MAQTLEHKKEVNKKWRKENYQNLLAYNRQWREKNKDRVHQYNLDSYSQNAVERRRYAREYHKLHQAECSSRKKKWVAENLEHCKEYSLQWHKKNPEKYKEWGRKRKLLVISHYGGKCECCQESRLDFLTIDHIDGGGRKHRKELNAHGSTFYKWLIRNKFPKDNFRVLCWNCNCAMRFTGVCPHKQQEWTTPHWEVAA